MPVKPCVRWIALSLLLAGAVPFAFAEYASACAVVRPVKGTVTIADESAIIIWDAKSKTQHFIRRASFTTDVQDFGFLVPTPTKPDLAEARDEAFRVLAEITAPVVWVPTGGGGCGCTRKSATGKAEKQVRVLEEWKGVAGFDAVALEADDAAALAGWLKKHGYVSSPALDTWLAPYIKAQWKIPAFTIAKDAPQSQRVATSALRMTFQSNRPFFPYREPDDQRTLDQDKAPRRLFRVYFVGAEKVKASIGEDGKPWPGQVAWSNPLPNHERDRLLRLLKLPEGTTPATWWLTEFEDRSAPRPGTGDVFFCPAGNQERIDRPGGTHGARVLPGCVMSYALLGYLLTPCLVRAWRRRRARRMPALLATPPVRPTA
jgi:hypothetical protein